MAMKPTFPKIHNNGKAEISGNQITFSHIDSYGIPMTETARVLSPKKIASMVSDRLARFQKAGPGSRESETSRQERKYISGHPESTIRAAWELLDDHNKMELEMMLDMSSHHGISDPAWMKTHARRRDSIIGDDRQALA